MAKSSLPQFAVKPTIHTFKDIEGQTFGKLTVIGFAGSDPVRQKARWWCQCECGNVITAEATNLRRHHYKSCGCTRWDGSARRTHGRAKTAEYKIYAGARTRCENPRTKTFQRYGARGIEFRFTSFEEFLAEVGLRPTPKHSLERIDNSRHYEPGNVKWATLLEQANNKSNNTRISVNGKEDTVPNWARATGLQATTIRARIKRGWCEECCVLNGDGMACQHKGVRA